MTRYPSKGKGFKWTVKELESIHASWKGDTLNDSEGLSGDVRVISDGQVSIAFRYCFKWEGKVSWFYCGAFPTIDIIKIRAVRDWANKQIKLGVDPRIKQVTNKIEEREKATETLVREAKRIADSLSVKDMFEVWVSGGVKRADSNKHIIQSFNKYILPSIGALEVKELTEHHLIEIYKAIVKDGKLATALELSKEVKQMISWAEKRKPWRALLVDGSPAELVEMGKLLPDSFTKVRDRVLSIDEIKMLKTVFEDSKNHYTLADKKYGVERPLKREVQIAMWLCLSTLSRIGELLMTKWEHVDFEKRTWFIPAENTKGRAKVRTSHTVYLSDFSLTKFKELKQITGGSTWAFPARYKDSHVCVKSASKQIGDRQLKFTARTKKLKYRVENNSLVLGHKEWTPHDLRRTGATMMQGLLDINNGLLVTDLCLHHNVVTGSAKHYLFEGYEEVMKDAWKKLGNRLEAILNAENVVSMTLKTA